MTLLMSLETIAGLEALETVQTGVAFDVVVVPLDVQFQLVASA